MACKGSLHVQRVLPWMRSLLAEWGATAVKIVDPCEGPDPFPGLRKVLRFHTDEWDRPLLATGRAGAEAYMARMMPTWQKLRGWGEVCFELPNEPECNADEGLRALDAFTSRCLEIATPAGIGLVVWNLAEGNPGANPGEEGERARATERWKMQQLVASARAAIAHGHRLGFHCYWKPGVEPPDGPYRALRYRANLRYLEEAGVDVARARLLITEAGIDGTIAGGRREGWQVLRKLEGYVKDVTLYEQKVREDPQVESYFLFTAGYHDPWRTYDHDACAVRRLVAPIRALGDPPPPTVPPTGGDGRTEAATIGGNPIVGRRFTRDEFAAHVATVPKRGIRLVVVHHTEKPDEARWLEFGGAYWMKALARFYSGQGWSSGPHVVVAPDGIWVLWHLDRDGTHTRGWNDRTWGVELVGNYADRLPTGQVLADGAWVLATLLGHEGLDLGGLTYHGFLQPGNPCPGARLVASWPWFVAQVAAALKPAAALPEQEPGTDVPTLAVKAAWWTEEIQRVLERSDWERAKALNASSIRLHRRLREAAAR